MHACWHTGHIEKACGTQVRNPDTFQKKLEGNNLKLMVEYILIHTLRKDYNMYITVNASSTHGYISTQSFGSSHSSNESSNRVLGHVINGLGFGV